MLVRDGDLTATRRLEFPCWLSIYGKLAFLKDFYDISICYASVFSKLLPIFYFRAPRNRRDLQIQNTVVQNPLARIGTGYNILNVCR